MAVKILDTLSGKKKTLRPRSGKTIEIFVCGPTVYDYSHIGHARTYVVFDAFVKYLRLLEYEVRYVQNITDLDDKIIERAKEISQPPADLARNFEKEYYHDMEAIGVDSPDKYARATDYIPRIISQVERLIAKGFAYEIPKDGIYFDISRYGEYGKLSRRTAGQAEDAVSRIDESAKKRNRGDFVLWKFSNPPAGGDEPKWPSPWGDGRPGWHIEDTAITETEFGAQYDIHGGARDLMFPHHESEIAQMEAISGKAPLVNYWMHTGFLTAGGEKMSKSLGNFITIHEFLKNHSREALRLFVLSSHYRSPIDYTEAAAGQAETNAERFKEFYYKLLELSGSDPDNYRGLTPSGLPELKKFYSALADDFNSPKALAVLFELIRKSNARIAEGKFSQKEAADVLRFLNIANEILGVIASIETGDLPGEIVTLADERQKARELGKWDEADKIRKEIEEKGYALEDTPAGPKIKRARNI